MKLTKLTSVVAFSFVSLSLSFPAFANSTLSVLMQDGVALLIAKSNGSQLKLTIEKDHSYQTDTGLRGTWAFANGELCLTRNLDSNPDGRGGARSCGALPDGLAVGDYWIDLSDGEPGTKLSIIKPVQ